jgi:alpha-L-fucosidase 2
MDFLVEHPNGKWLVTNPSNSPENPPKGPGYRYFCDEVTSMYYFTTICAGSSIDMQILRDLFGYYIEATKILGKDENFAGEVAAARKRLVPPQIGKDETLQEWTDDWEQLEDKHRHFSHLYGLYPGNVISAKRTPQFINAVKAVLEQRGDGGPGFSRAWKMNLWARLYDGERAYKIFKGYLKDETYPQLFAQCYSALLVEGALGVTAGLTELLVQSHEGTIELLPALPSAWHSGEFNGVCARGAFELDMQWQDSGISKVEVLSKAGQICWINPGVNVVVKSHGKYIEVKKHSDGSIMFNTTKGTKYILLAN